jgi:hypothetical protein
MRVKRETSGCPHMLPVRYEDVYVIGLSVTVVLS